VLIVFKTEHPLIDLAYVTPMQARNICSERLHILTHFLRDLAY